MSTNVDSLLVASFPLRKGPRGYFATATGADAIAEMIEQVLGTIPGERVMRPSFGCDIHKRLFAPNDNTEAQTARADIAEALRLWVPMISVLGGVQGVEATIDGHTVSYTVRYRVNGGPVQIADGEITLRSGR